MGSHWSDKPVRSESMFHTQRLCFHDTFSSVVNPMLLVPILAVWCSCCAVHWTTEMILSRKYQGKLCLFAPHRLMQQHTEAEKAVAEGWDQNGGGGGGEERSWGSFWPHISAVVLCYCAWPFHTQNTLASAIKDIGKTHVNNFPIANLSGFYLLLFPPCEIWLLLGKSLKLGGFL